MTDAHGGRVRASFADDADTDEFVAMLARYRAGELSDDQWRAFRDTRGVIIQPQRDTYKVRIKVPQGVLTAGALRTIADLTEQASRGDVHAATRQDIQIHFVRLKDAETFLRRLASVGLTTREGTGNSVHNVAACSFAGVCPDEVFDVSPYAEALTRHFLRHPLTSSLPRKFKMSFGGCGRGCACEPVQDLGFSARTRVVGGRVERGFKVFVGGGLGVLYQSGRVLHEFLPAGELLQAAEAVIRLFHKHGNRKNKAKARLKYLIEKMGWEAWKALHDAKLELVRAEGALPLPFDPERPPVEGAPEWPRRQAPTVEEVAARAAAAVVHGHGMLPEPVPAVPAPIPEAEAARFGETNVKAQRQDGYVAVIAHLPLAALTGAQLRILADLAEAYGDGTVRNTQRQDMLLRWVRREDAPELHRRLHAAGLGRAGAETIADITSCPGRESCRFALTQSRGLARELEQLLCERDDLAHSAADAAIKISGCPYGCSHHPIATIGFQGGFRRLSDGTLIPQYQMFLGGWIDGEAGHFGRRSVKIPARHVPEAVTLLLERHRDAGGGKSAADYFRDLDLAEVEKMLHHVCSISARTVKPEDYVDFGREEDITAV